jgi:hypothetical protein
LALVKRSQWKVLRLARAVSRGAKVVGSASSMVGMRMVSKPCARRPSARAEAWCGARVMRMRGGSGFPPGTAERKARAKALNAMDAKVNVKDAKFKAVAYRGGWLILEVPGR